MGSGLAGNCTTLEVVVTKNLLNHDMHESPAHQTQQHGQRISKSKRQGQHHGPDSDIDPDLHNAM